MDFLPWVLVALVSFLAGSCLVLYLVASPQRMNSYLFVLLLLVGGGLLFCVKSFPLSQALSLIALNLGTFLAGYLVTTAIFLGLHEKRALPAITRMPGEKGKGHTAVIYFTHGEPPAYSIYPWLETIREFDHDKAAFIPFPFRPFFFFGLRKEYLKAGGSPHNIVHGYLFRAVQASIPEKDRAGLRFHLAFLDSNPRPDEMAIRAINDGADRIILLPIFITISSHTQAGEEMVAALQPEKYGVSVQLAEPLWNSNLLRQVFVAQAEATRRDTDREHTGILLVGHGQPKAWDAIYPTQTEHENQYREGIKELLVKKGYLAGNVLPVWMSFQSPSIAQGLHSLVANGVTKILVFSVSISAAALHSDVDVPEAIHKAKLPGSVEVINMGAFGDPFDPLVVGAIREKLLASL